ncbi:GNAT family N-acetyltransferase [Candidatus Peregrinibacteria bacterium]|nr:GNAT family N-acetyltransferase [Candidatus Peregrinibacteria bacterium]
MKIIFAKTSDIVRCHEIDAAIGIPTHPAFLRETQKYKKLIIAKDSKKIIGYMCYSVLWGTLPFVHFIRIHPLWQRKGVGSFLLQFLEKKIKTEKFSCLLSSTEHDNRNSFSFHKKNGFSSCGKIKFNKKETEVFFIKNIPS